jgi:hypothetical protein
MAKHAVRVSIKAKMEAPGLKIHPAPVVAPRCTGVTPSVELTFLVKAGIIILL